MPMQYQEKKAGVKIENVQLIFSCTCIYSKHRLWVQVRTASRLGEAVLTSTHNLRFGSKLRKIGIPQHAQVILYKTGVFEGIHFTDMYS